MTQITRARRLGPFHGVLVGRAGQHRHGRGLHPPGPRRQHVAQPGRDRGQRAGRRRQRLRRRHLRHGQRLRRSRSVRPDGRAGPRYPHGRDHGRRGRQRDRRCRRRVARERHGAPLLRRERLGRHLRRHRLHRLRDHDEGAWRQRRGHQRLVGLQREQRLPPLGHTGRRRRRHHRGGGGRQRRRRQARRRQRHRAVLPGLLRLREHHRRGGVGRRRRADRVLQLRRRIGRPGGAGHRHLEHRAHRDGPRRLCLQERHLHGGAARDGDDRPLRGPVSRRDRRRAHRPGARQRRPRGEPRGQVRDRRTARRPRGARHGGAGHHGGGRGRRLAQQRR